MQGVTPHQQVLIEMQADFLLERQRQRQRQQPDQQQLAFNFTRSNTR